MPAKVKHPFQETEGKSKPPFAHPLAICGAVTGICITVKPLGNYLLRHKKITTYSEYAMCTAILAVFSLLLGLALDRSAKGLAHILLRKALTYQGWITQPKALKTKVWGMVLQVLRGSEPFSTFEFQEFLPKQPLPQLDQTLTRWVEVAKMFQEPNNFELTKQYVEDFRSNEGPKLQKFLQNKADTEDSWIHDYWMNGAYLSSRKPLAVYNNYFMAHVSRCRPVNHLARAATLTYFIAKFERMLSEEKIAPVFIQKLIPLCMEGFKFLFNSNRYPGECLDEIVRYPGHGHVVVIRKGVFFKVNLYHIDDDGNKSLCTPHELNIQLESVVCQADALDSNCSTRTLKIASLTSQDRTTWAKQRKKLCVRNAATVHEIDSAMFVLSLDERSPEKNEDFIHLQFVGDNVWFDKCFNMIVYENGWGGTNVEHSSLDAMVFVVIMEYISLFEDYDGTDVIKTGDPKPQPPPAMLQWEIKDMENEIKMAEIYRQKLADDIQVTTVTPPYGKGFMKQQKISPDGYIQMSLQLAYYKMHKKFPKTYEPSTARMFLLGRTDTVHPGSMKSQAWVKAMCDDTTPRDTKIELLKEAVKIQTEFRLQATLGYGCDRHLMALMCASRELGMDMPNIFKDKPWVEPFTLSTSQSPNMFVEYGVGLDFEKGFGGFGPTADHGYGVGYCVFGDDRINFQISCWKTSAETDAHRFGQHIVESFQEVKVLLKPT